MANVNTVNTSIKTINVNTPLDSRTVVATHNDMLNIQNPYVGMTITVLQDDQNEMNMTDYKVLSLKSNALGIPNSMINEVQSLTVYALGFTREDLIGNLTDMVQEIQDNTTAINSINASQEQLSTDIATVNVNKASTSQVQEVQQQVNNLVLGAVGDGNNAEVIQARGSYSALNDRLDADEDKSDLIESILVNHNLATNFEATKIDATVESGKYIRINDPTIAISTVSGSYIKFIQYALQGEKKMRIFTTYGPNIEYDGGFCFCRGNGTTYNYLLYTYMPSIANNQGGYITVDVPDQATHLFVSTGKNHHSATKMVMPSIESIDTTLKTTKNLNYNYMKMFQRIAVIGDEIASGYIYDSSSSLVQMHYGNSWLSYIAREINATRGHYSEGGLTAKEWYNTYHGLLTSDTPYNAYFIALGTRDANYNKYPLGTIDDTTSTDSFVGHYKKIIELIQSYASNSVIFCCSRYSYIDTGGYNSMIKAITESYTSGVYYVDIANKSEIRLGENNEYSTTGNFTTVGHIALAKNIMRLVNEIILENQNYFNNFMLNNDSETQF